MKKIILATLSVAALTGCSRIEEYAPDTIDLRAPSYPIVTIDPYTSAWSPYDNLYDGQVEHWTGKPFPLVGVLTVDGTPYRFLGKEKISDYKALANAGRSYPWSGSYTISKPASNWMRPDYREDGTWKESLGGFGPENRKPMTSTWINENDVWVRREVQIKMPENGEVFLHVSNMGDAEYYINGIEIAKTGPAEMDYYRVSKEVLATFDEGRAVLAAHSHHDNGKACIDMGLYTKTYYKENYPKTAVQKVVAARPHATFYHFECGPVDLQIYFTSPRFLDDLESISNPIDFINYKCQSMDGKFHDIKFTIDAGAEVAQNYPIDEQSKSEAYTSADGKFSIAKTGGTLQQVLGRDGDNVRIDWGYFYLAGLLPHTNVAAFEDGDIQLNQNFDRVTAATGNVFIGYDDLYSIQYFGENLRPYWNRNGDRTFEEVLAATNKAKWKTFRKARVMDKRLMKEAAEVGGKKYANLCGLAYRQAVAAHKLVVSPSGDLMMISKECNSNGSAGTVDVTYPSMPMFLLYNPKLGEALLNHIYEYAEGDRWTKPFPPHDMGRYPICNGQYYPKDMPVEEAGNMLIMTAAICHFEEDYEYAAKHWPILSKWCEYLSEFGLDPDDHLCTDDFAGHLAHNVNLSAKAIMAIASYAQMAREIGYTPIADKYRAMAEDMAAQWVSMADDGDHYRLTFDRPGTFSMKYNLVWDKLLHLNVFPEEVAAKEVAYYIENQNRYGMPLDSRSAYTKTDWIVWAATMAESDDDFAALVAPVWDFYNETTSRVPMSDWYWTDKPEWCAFKARSVVGAVFIKLLEEKR